MREDGSALNDSVTYRNNVGVGEAWAVGVKEAKDFAKTMTVVSDGQFFAVFFSVVTVLDEAVAFPDAFDKPTGDCFTGGGVNELVFDRGRSGVDDKNCCV